MSTVVSSRGSLFKKVSIWDICALLLVYAGAINWKLTDVVFVFLILAIGIFEFRNKWKGIRKLSYQLRWMSLFVGVFFCSTVIGYFISTSMGAVQIDEILGLRWILALYACIYLGTKVDLDNIRLNLLSLIYFAILFVGVLFQYFVLQKGGRLEGTFGNANVFAYSVAIPWTFMFAMESIGNSQKERNDFLILFSLFGISIMEFLTYGRGTWLSILLVILIGSMILKNHRNFFSLIAISVVAAVMYLGNVLQLKDRILYSFNFSSGTSQGVRAILWKVNWLIFKDHPIFGVGLYENFRMLEIYYMRYGIENHHNGEPGNYINHAHNQYLQVLVGAGGVGFVAYMILLLLTGRFFLKKYRERSDGQQKIAFAGFMTLLMFVFTSLVDCPLLVHESRSYLFIFCGLCAGFLLEERRSNV